jgi:hypothetical protein
VLLLVLSAAFTACTRQNPKACANKPKDFCGPGFRCQVYDNDSSECVAVATEDASTPERDAPARPDERPTEDRAPGVSDASPESAPEANRADVSDSGPSADVCGSQTDPRNCGACGNDCGKLPNVIGATTCVDG